MAMVSSRDGCRLGCARASRGWPGLIWFANFAQTSKYEKNIAILQYSVAGPVIKATDRQFVNDFKLLWGGLSQTSHPMVLFD